jgi:hypothetical protein
MGAIHARLDCWILSALYHPIRRSAPDDRAIAVLCHLPATASIVSLIFALA